MYNLLQKDKGQARHASPSMSGGLMQAGKQVLGFSCVCLRHAEKEAQKGLGCGQVRCFINSRLSVIAAP